MSQSYERPWTKMASMEELQGKNPAGKKKKEKKPQNANLTLAKKHLDDLHDF